MKARILIIEDDSAVAQALVKELRAEGYQADSEAKGDTGLARATEENFDLVISDLRLPGMGGLELVEQFHRAKPDVPILLMTAHGTTETAIEATKKGAFDYILKPFEMGDFLTLVSKAVSARRLLAGPLEMGELKLGRSAIIGRSAPMQELYKQIGRIAATPLPVLILGETGTGKEMVARAIFQYSDRSNGPFIAVNCAAVPETLLESELFGHERGAFTGAEARRIGRFEQAHGGTLFLDEIGDLTLNTQAKLLRVLQEKQIQRLGGRDLISVDVRILAATHRNLKAAIEEKLFREDLLYRINAITLTLPPLRDRSEDIPDLVKYFVSKHAAELGSHGAIQPEALDYLKHQPWPGNVRQLQNVIREAILLARGFPVSLDHVRALLDTQKLSRELSTQSMAEYISGLLTAAENGQAANLHSTAVRDIERELYSQAIQRADGNQAMAARWLGVTRTTLREKLFSFGIHPAQDLGDDGDKAKRSSGAHP